MGEYTLSIIQDEDGLWNKRSKLEKKLMVAIVVLFLLSFGLIIDLIVVKNSIQSNSEDLLVCQSKECLISAAAIQSSLDTTADPCDDFYQFACGGWMRDNIIPPHKSSWSNFDIANKRLLDNLRVILESDDKVNETSIFGKTIGLYKQCMNSTKRELDGIEDLKQFVASIEWPMINHGNVSTNYDWPKVFAKLTYEQDTNFILNTGVTVDEKNTTIYTLYVTQPSFGIGREQLTKPDEENSRKIITAYKTYILSTVRLFVDQTYPSLEEDIQLMVDFEEKLANITSKPLDFRNRTLVYGAKITLDQFMEKYRGVPLLSIQQQLFKNIPGANLTGDTLLVVYDRPYLERLGDLLAETDSKIIANYLGWRIVQDMGKYTNKAMRDIIFEFKRRVSGVREPTPLWQMCVNTVKQELTYALGRLYADKHFTEGAKKDINLLIDELDKAFRQLLDEQNDWMERHTKDRALNKLDQINRAIGYPDFIKQDQLLEDYYQEYNFDSKNSFFKSMSASNQWSARQEFKKLNAIITNRNDLEWGTGGAVVNAYYKSEDNRITFPAGILQPPFYELGRPMSMNLGAIGMAIGHELTHSLDEEGSQYDEKGNLLNWWDDITHERFNEKLRCFTDQYSKYNDSVAARPINGELTLDENIADNGGLGQAFRALENYRGVKHLLPTSMKSFTTEQLFFLSFANIWCKNERKEALISQLETDAHSPARYRVLGSVSNSQSFAKAFNCNIGSKMNPKSKCVLW